MARPKPQPTTIERLSASLELAQGSLGALRGAHPDLRKVPPHRREAIKAGRAELEHAADTLRAIINQHAAMDDLDLRGNDTTPKSKF